MTISEAKKLLTEIQGNCLGENILEGYDDPKRTKKAEALGMAIGALNGPQWIPCSERMPEYPDEVITTYIVNGNHKRRYVETATYYDNEEEGYWNSPWDEYRVQGTKVEYIAWMPLPEPYREEE